MQKFEMPKREQISNKATFGKVLNFSGCKNYIGASYLSTVSVLKIGAGLVALATEKEVIHSVSTLLPEAIYLSRSEGLKNIDNFSTILIGCGLGQKLSSIKIFNKVIKKLQNSTFPIIIDADGLNILAKNNMRLPMNSIITPHPLEAARLLDVSIEYILENVEKSAQTLATKFNCVVVLKTHRTVICEREKIFVNQHGNSALAKAGSGDVLAGIIAGLVAQKMPLFDAAKLGVYLHSRCGEIASEELSEYSVLASDLPKFLHRAIQEII